MGWWVTRLPWWVEGILVIDREGLDVSRTVLEIFFGRCVLRLEIWGVCDSLEVGSRQLRGWMRSRRSLRRTSRVICFLFHDTLLYRILTYMGPKVDGMRTVGSQALLKVL